MGSVSLSHIQGQMLGYGRTGEEIGLALNKLGVETKTFYVGEEGLVPPTALFVQLPGHSIGWHRNQKSVLFSMFETTQLPAEFAEKLHEYDVVVVPCQQNYEAFREHVKGELYVIPLGVNPDVWHYTPRKPVTDREPFTFLVTGAGWRRKGIDIAIRAFKELRDELHLPMRLIVKMQSAEWNPNDFPHDDDVHYLKQRLTPEEEVKLYADVHCHLAPSKGEGWGLCPHQAIAQGCPTILTDAGGMHEFAHYGIPIGWHHENAVYGIWEDTGEWWAPNYDELVAAMRDVYENQEDHFARAKEQAENISHLTWENTARQLLEIMDVEPEVPAGGWRELERLKFPIMVNQDTEANVGGIKYVFKKGKTYYEWADVKRVIYQQGLMHADCPVDGLTSSECAEWTAREHICPECKRPYQTTIEIAEEVTRELAGKT